MYMSWAKRIISGSALVLTAFLLIAGCPNPAGGDPDKAARPVATPPSGEVETGATVALSTATEGADIYYTLDGSNPDKTKARYTTAVRASVPPGWIVANRAVSLKAGEGTVIYYTLDGTEPDTSNAAQRYDDAEGVVIVGEPGETVTLRAAAARGSNRAGETLAVTYTIDPRFKPGNSADDAWLGDSHAGKGTEAETWGLRVLDMRHVYFGVRKAAGQTIVPSATDGGSIEALTEAADGLEPGPTLAVFKVDANKIHNDKRSPAPVVNGVAVPDADAYYDTQFEGGDDFTFVLTVGGGTPPLSKTITVNLRAEVTLDNALFMVNKATGELTQVRGIKEYSGGAPKSQIAPVAFDTTKEGTRFIDMLVWFDTHYGAFKEGTPDAHLGGAPNLYEEGAEYLIRVAQNDDIPCVYITLPLDDTTTKLRLRGAGQERVVSATPGIVWQSSQYYNSTLHGQTQELNGINRPTTQNSHRGLINMRRGVLQLEKNISLQGDSLWDNRRHNSIIQIGKNTTLIMKEGAVVRGHTGLDLGSAGTIMSGIPMYLNGNRATTFFIMEGGAIRDNTGIPSVIRLASGTFIKTGGSITGNTPGNSRVSANSVLIGLYPSGGTPVEHEVGGDWTGLLPEDE
jgi:hypothetical protein